MTVEAFLSAIWIPVLLMAKPVSWRISDTLPEVCREETLLSQAVDAGNLA
ncbi:MAG: hypothetical protein ABF968_15510 [Acetobacter sp.]